VRGGAKHGDAGLADEVRAGTHHAADGVGPGDGASVATEPRAGEQPRIVGVDDVAPAGHERDVGVAVVREHGDLALETRRIEQVVVAEELGEGGARHRDGAVPVAGGAERALVAYEADARVAEAFDDVRGAVGRAVVGHDQLEVVERLRERRLDRPADPPRMVVGGDADRDGGRHSRHPSRGPKP
jgi:hypothetical protein